MLSFCRPHLLDEWGQAGTLDFIFTRYLPTKHTTSTMATTGLIPNWYPPSRENYDLVISLWKWFPVVCIETFTGYRLGLC